MSAQAGGEVGRVSGRIVDEDTARPLSLAQISITALNTGTLSDVDGRWTMESLPPGTYDVVARLIGYTSKTITGVTVTAGDVTTIDISLPPRAGRYEPNTREVLYRESGGVFLWDNFIQSGSIFHQDLTEDAINLNLDVQFPIRVNG
ncbi:carboxypeptidase-like regulatory domain-containing protein [Candidatus Palauibacter sp.]|uniref:carboxypeptidase-like regulatory domain-containing protein n=1 Tax=Candidatus Palauibacter sp. TaxID=3101350 RepID=UPI003C6EE905